RLSCQPAGCGDGIIDDGELCDGSAVGSATCGNINLGFSGGTLSCNDTCEGYDTSECTETPASCGDGNLDAGEECDNGTANSDTTPNACRENCTLAGCGDNVVDDGEACDQGSANSDTTPNACRSTCELPTCGDAVQDTGEECDNGANNSNTVPNACRSTCRNPYCGDGVIDDLRTEECDGTNLDGETCFTQGATGGSISCTGLCILDVSNCLFIDPPEAAGDVVITELLQDPNSLVEADGEWFEVFNPSTTQSRNLDGCEIGHLESDVFVADDDIDTTLIIPPQGLLLFVRNGDSAVNGGLTGDFDYASSVSMNNTGTDSLVLSCGGTEIDRVVWSAAEVTAGRSWALSRDQHTAAANDNVDNWCLGSGTYGSSPNQGTPKDFNPTCPSCGDGTVSPGEDCDGGIGTNTCASIGGGFSGGSLSCDPVTCLWNTSACYGCGDGTVNPGEDCDGGIGTNTCASIGAGFSGGTLACNTTTCLWNTSGCTSPGCGNSVIDTGEQCDGSNL
ncbi:MAG: lamin tail domain-containing protein, partial [Myxococcota bacterium]|nr:lamin tail domain-containing protein [Myxococcota bacterium]